MKFSAHIATALRGVLDNRIRKTIGALVEAGGNVSVGLCEVFGNRNWATR